MIPVRSRIGEPGTIGQQLGQARCIPRQPEHPADRGSPQISIEQQCPFAKAKCDREVERKMDLPSLPIEEVTRMILCGLSRLSSEMAVRIVRTASAKRGSTSPVSSLLPIVLTARRPGS